MTDTTTTELIRAFVTNIEAARNINTIDTESVEWDSFSIVMTFPDGVFSSAAGYVYPADGTIVAATMDPWSVTDAVKQYMDSRYKEGEKLPVKILVQFDKRSGKYTVQFEDTDEMRWKVTPKNFKTLREELRPRFE